ncbi:hypothetical protein [Streptomyces hebeiensis]
MGTFTNLIARHALFTSYRKNIYNIDPNIRGAAMTLSPMSEATELVRQHVAAYGGPRAIGAEPYGAVTMSQGDTRIRMEPGMDARPSLLTRRQADDLLLLAYSATGARVAHEQAKGWTIHAGFSRIPPAATENLVKHGWVVTTGTDGASVTVSLAGIVALTWRHCKTAKIPNSQWGDAIAESVYDAFSA